MTFRNHPIWQVFRDHPDLHPTERSALHALVSYADTKTGIAYPFQATLAEDVGVSDRTLRRLLAHLEELGLIEVEVNAAEESARRVDRRSNRYRLPWLVAQADRVDADDHPQARVDVHDHPQDATGGHPRPSGWSPVTERVVTHDRQRVDTGDHQNYQREQTREQSTEHTPTDTEGAFGAAASRPSSPTLDRVDADDHPHIDRFDAPSLDADDDDEPEANPTAEDERWHWDDEAEESEEEHLVREAELEARWRAEQAAERARGRCRAARARGRCSRGVSPEGLAEGLCGAHLGKLRRGEPIRYVEPLRDPGLGAVVEHLGPEADEDEGVF
jgi:hypothetical protein